MDTRERDDILDALRSAQRALRKAEKALVQAPVTDNSDEDVRDSRDEATSGDPAEKALSDFLFGAAAKAKQYEEQDPQSFRARFEPMRDELLGFVLTKRMVQESPKGSGTVQLDPTDGTQTYEKCLKACTENNINQTELMRPFVESADLKNWGDVNVNVDLVLMRYETPGPVTTHVDEAALQGLMEGARKTPGAVDRTQAALREAGIGWDMADANGNLATELTVPGVKGQWAACIDTRRIVAEIVGRLSIVEVDYGSKQQGWWDAARLDHGLPIQLLPIVRNKDPSIVCHRDDVRDIEHWAAQLPGWYDGDDDSPTPLVFRDALPDDILS